MSPIVKVFVSGGVGSLVSSYAEPYIIKTFPQIAGDAASMQRKALGVAVAGGASVLVYKLLGEAK